MKEEMNERMNELSKVKWNECMHEWMNDEMQWNEMKWKLNEMNEWTNEFMNGMKWDEMKWDKMNKQISEHSFEGPSAPRTKQRI